MARRPVIAMLGGGQLGRMFIENALRYPVDVHVLDPDADAPCSRIAHRFVRGPFDDTDTVLRFAEEADVVGIEIEHVSVEALDELRRRGKRVVPDPSCLRTIKDKGAQKAFYREHGIPTADFVLLDDRDAIARNEHMLPAFQKSRTGGYDGRGVRSIDGVADIASAIEGPSLLEKRVDIDRELAVIVVRGLDGATNVYDPVEMVFDPRHNLVDHLQAPARVDQGTLRTARELAVSVANAFASPGVFAIELFLTRTGELLVNETAPRVHNSGHHTIEACASSQFDQLLRVHLGWPLGDTRLRSMAAMINLIGEGGAGPVVVKGLEEILRTPGTFLHLYGKAETRTGRKMGHVTAVADTQEDLDRAIRTVKAHARVVPAASERAVR
jgi:5-(carboxyamino)imidazole ribonucleotide synthase